jgi:hypothetical protein
MKKTHKPIRITDGQDNAISQTIGFYNMDKSNIVCEGGSEQKNNNGDNCFIGSFLAHIYRKGVYRFDCKFEVIDGCQYYTVVSKRIK